VESVQQSGRRWRPSLLATAVTGVVVAVSLTAFVVTRGIIYDQEDRLLDERRAEVGVLLQSSFGAAEAALRALAGVGAAAGDGAAADDAAAARAVFERSAEPIVTSDGVTVAAAVDDGAGGFEVSAAVGDRITVGSTLTGERAEVAARAWREGRLATELLDGDGPIAWLVVAAPAAGPVPAVALQESPIPRVPVPPSPGSPFGEMRAVLYASPNPNAEKILLTTERDGRRIEHGSEAVLDIGVERWLLVVGAREPLVGGLAHVAPWLLLAGGLVAAVLAGAVAETSTRRRSYALALVDERTRALRDALTERDETRAFLERLLDAGPVAVVRSTLPFSRLSYVSPNIERLFGHRVEDASVDGFLLDHVHPDDRAAFDEALDRLTQGASASTVDVRFRHANGDERWVTIDIVPERRGPNGDEEPAAATETSAPAAVAYLQDVDDRRRLEHVQREAQRAAEAANQAKSDFLSRMSHELRTPLNAVIGFAQLLEMDDLTVTQRDSVHQIVRGGEHLLDLINEVLDIARIETGRLRLSLEPVRLDDVVHEVVDLVRPLAVARGIAIPYKVPQTCGCHVYGDRQRLKQVLLNLIGNAVKYNRDHGRVDVDCEPVSDGRVRVRVADTGPGIAPEKLEMVFTPFERLDAETTGIEGTGLGLALARGLVDAMGGELGVESTVGVGSTFWVDLALTSAPVELAEAADSPPAPPEPARVSTVLYIEDNLSNVRLVERILAHRPHIRPIVAMQGQMGIELAQRHHPDLVLLDLNLPDMDGEEVLARLKAEPGCSDIPVVVVSADATARQIARLRASGASDYLTKPLDVARFLQVLDAHVGGPQPVATNLPRARREPIAMSILDTDVLSGLLELVGAGDGLAEMVATFKDESSARVESLRRAVASGDRAAVHDLAQSLRSIAGTFGDVTTMRVCSTLQEHAARGDDDMLVQLVDDLELALARSQRELDGYLTT
jgi:signal transduction histidine kinase/DNA-binding NarL/FixJ family response regulator